MSVEDDTSADAAALANQPTATVVLEDSRDGAMPVLLTEIRVLDVFLHPLAEGYGRLQLDLPPGIYTATFRNGEALVREAFYVSRTDATQSVHKRIVPSQHNVLDWFVNLATPGDTGKSWLANLPATSGVAILPRISDGAERPALSQSRLSISLHDKAGKDLSGSRTDSSGPDIGSFWAVPPGQYRVRLGFPGGIGGTAAPPFDVEGMATVLHNRQTRLYLAGHIDDQGLFRFDPTHSILSIRQLGSRGQLDILSRDYEYRLLGAAQAVLQADGAGSLRIDRVSELTPWVEAVGDFLNRINPLLARLARATLTTTIQAVNTVVGMACQRDAALGLYLLHLLPNVPDKGYTGLAPTHSIGVAGYRSRRPPRDRCRSVRRRKR